MACNASTAIIMNLILSKKFLGETFIWKYDCTALILICAGCTTIVLNAHTSPVKYTQEETIEVLTSARTLIFFAVGLIYFLAMLALIKCYLAKLRVFESDVDFFDEARKSRDSNYKPILEPRQKANVSEEVESQNSIQEPLIDQQ